SRNVTAAATAPSSSADPTPLSVEDARKAIDAAEDRDGIFESVCRGTRARLPFAAILLVHGDVAAGRLALGAGWFDKNALAVVSERSTLTAAAARSVRRLILRAKGGEYAKAAPTGGTKLSTSESAEGMASGGAWRRPTGEGGEVRARPTQPRFSVALVNAVKNELQTGNPVRATSPGPREDAAP